MIPATPSSQTSFSSTSSIPSPPSSLSSCSSHSYSSHSSHTFPPSPLPSTDGPLTWASAALISFFDPVLVYDLQGRVQFRSQAYETIFGPVAKSESGQESIHGLHDLEKRLRVHPRTVLRRVVSKVVLDGCFRSFLETTSAIYSVGHGRDDVEEDKQKDLQQEDVHQHQHGPVLVGYTVLLMDLASMAPYLPEDSPAKESPILAMGLPETPPTDQPLSTQTRTILINQPSTDSPCRTLRAPSIPVASPTPPPHLSFAMAPSGRSQSMPTSTIEPLSAPAARSSARSTSLGHLLTLPAPKPASGPRPRSLSVAATAISSTSSGAQLSVSVSASADKSRLDIHHNSVAPTTEAKTTLLIPATQQFEREWDDPFFPYLAPIATSLLCCQGDSFFEVVVEEVAFNLGVKYAFISQLVSLEELKELDPAEYTNLIDQFGGLVPPIDGVMHNISSWPGDPDVNPHAFEGFLADCTIQEKVTCLHSNLAELHPDVADCLVDQSIESYLGLRLETAQGEIVGVIGIIHDQALTGDDAAIVRVVLEQVGIRVANELDRSRVEANLIYARDVAESTAKNKTKFLADMSHEIRNPMNAVVGVTDILLDTVGLSEEQTQYIEVIRTSGQHLLTVINDILDISRIDQDVKFLLEKRPLSLRKCLKDAVSLAGLTPLHDVSRSISVIEWPPEMDDLGPFSELEETNVLPLLWSIDHDVPEHLMGDITRLRQVLINLCTNSLKFTQHGRVSVKVSIYSPKRKSTYQLTSHPASPTLTGIDMRPPVVFQQRYDVDTQSAQSSKPPPSSRRRPVDSYSGTGSRSQATHTMSHHANHLDTAQEPNTVKVYAPSTNSLEDAPKDSNMVMLEFSVSDTGVGIPASKITQLFTSFSQVDISVSTRFGGTGLGLAISASLVEKMGGRIWVESTEGVGSRFTFTIPFTVCHSSDTDSHPSVTGQSSPILSPAASDLTSAIAANTKLEQAGMEPLPEAVPVSSVSAVQGEISLEAPIPRSPPSSASPSMAPTYANVVESRPQPLTMEDGTPLRILLAEDNAVNQKIALGVLKKLGYVQVDVASNGKEVIQYLDRGSVYDVILMDVNMPVLDGLEATRLIVERRTQGLLLKAALKEVLSQTNESVDQDQSQMSMAEPHDVTQEESYHSYANLYVIALTASAMGSDRERCIAAGMDDFMTKPFALLEMKRALKEYMFKWEEGAIQTRNEAAVAVAMAAKSQGNSPLCSHAAALQAPGASHRPVTPTFAHNATFTHGIHYSHETAPTQCSGCSGFECGSGQDGNVEGQSSHGPPVSSPGRSVRLEIPRPVRRALEASGSSLFSMARRSHSEAVGSAPSSALSVTMEGARLTRRSSEHFLQTRREWRDGTKPGWESQVPHPLEKGESAKDEVMLVPPVPSLKRTLSPSGLSNEQTLSTLQCKVVSPLSPVSPVTSLFGQNSSESASLQVSGAVESTVIKEKSRLGIPLPLTPPPNAMELSKEIETAIKGTKGPGDLTEQDGP